MAHFWSGDGPIVDPHSVAIDRAAISKSQTTAQQEKPSGHGAAVVKPYCSQPTFARGCMGQPLQPHIDPEVSTSQFIGGGGCPVQLLVKIGCENRRLQCGMVRTSIQPLPAQKAGLTLWAKVWWLLIKATIRIKENTHWM